MNPSSGFCTMATSIEMDPRPLEGLHSVQFVVNPSTLPEGYVAMSRAQLQTVLIEGYIRPYYTGWHRPVFSSTPVPISGIEFTPQPSTLGLGFIGPPTRITVSFPSDRPQFTVQNIFPGPEMLTHLLSTNSTAGTRTKAEIVKELPMRVVEDTVVRSCSVCMSEFERGERVKSLPCCNSHTVHEFHATCIDQWLSRSQVCPVCKVNVQEIFNQSLQMG